MPGSCCNDSPTRAAQAPARAACPATAGRQRHNRHIIELRHQRILQTVREAVNPDSRMRHRPADLTSRPAGGTGYRAVSDDQPVVQALPLTVKAVGGALLMLHVPWNPKDVLAPGAMPPL